jgi:hypothetical protein
MSNAGAIFTFAGGVLAAAVISWLFRRSDKEPTAVGVGFLIALLSHYPLVRVYGGRLSFITYMLWVTVVAAAFTLVYSKLRKK